MNPANPPAFPAQNRRVLVTGADGFLAGFIVAALCEAGWQVLRGVRKPNSAAPDTRHCDFNALTTVEQWLPMLNEVDAVVNVAGILRERHDGDFHRVHEVAPLALAQACVACGVRQFVQISALGEAADGPFIATKHAFDQALLALPLHSLVLRPSVVYSPSGSYGGTSLLRALAATPLLMPVPGDGRWNIQPLAAEDLARLVVLGLQQQIEGVFEVGGPQVLSLLDYQRTWRRWLRLPAVPVLQTPTALVSAAVKLGEHFGGGPLGATSWRMLRRGNVTAVDAQPRLQQAFGCAPRALEQVLASRPSQVQDRWQAQLYFLAPLLRAAVIVLFLLSAWVGFVTPAAQIEQLSSGSALLSWAPVALARSAATLDVLLGIALLLGLWTRPVIVAMLMLVGTYTLAFGVLLPQLWLDPLGGLAKNLLVLPALALLWVLSERR